MNKTYTQSDLDAAILATVEKCADVAASNGGTLEYRSLRDGIASQIRATLPADIAQRVAAREKRLQLEATKEAIIQCAIESGELNSKGMWSGMMLGDMWKDRIAALEAELAKEQK
jgi:hypothetical protein